MVEPARRLPPLPRQLFRRRAIGPSLCRKISLQLVESLLARCHACQFFGHFPVKRPQLGRFYPMLARQPSQIRSEEHTSELQSLMRITYAVFCLKKKRTQKITVT